MKRRNNGAGHIRQKPDGRWEALYYVNGERRYITGRKGETATDVQRRLNEALHNLDRGIEAPKDNRQTVGEYMASWLVTTKPTVELTYWDRAETLNRLYITPQLGKVPLTKLTAQQVQQLYAYVLDLPRSPGTVTKMHVILHKALEDALKLGLISRNVAHVVTKPKIGRHDLNTYTPEQANRLLEAARGDRVEALYVLMLTTACRLGELLGLRWSSLDLDRREMRITAAMKELRGHMNLGIPKTPHSIRTIPLTHRAVDALRQHHINQKIEYLKHGGNWNPDGLVFCTTAGTPMNRGAFRLRQYIPMLQKAGLHYIRPHDLRHTAATLLFLEGVPPLVVSEMLGHASPTFTMSVYGHVQAEMREKARDTMERLFAANPGK